MQYSSTSATSQDLVQLDADHPGFQDRDYRKRRNEIALLALRHFPESALPRVRYTDGENALWRRILNRLAPLQDAKASRFILALRDRMNLDPSRIPQLADLNPRLRTASGFSMVPVAGLVTPRRFLEFLGDGRFPSTQYIRHASRPFYTPEPDIVHELVGHAATLLDPRIAEVNRRFGQAAREAETAAEVSRIVRVYWYTLEFGVVRESGVPKAFGAGLLSSVDELSRVDTAGILVPFDLAAASTMPYDPTTMQPRLFVAPSADALLDALLHWLRQRAWRKTDTE